MCAMWVRARIDTEWREGKGREANAAAARFDWIEKGYSSLSPTWMKRRSGGLENRRGRNLGINFPTMDDAFPSSPRLS